MGDKAGPAHGVDTQTNGADRRSADDLAYYEYLCPLRI